MSVLAIPAFTDNYIWILIDEPNAVFDCIDPGETKPVLDWAKANHLALRSILLTHHHNDHICGTKELLNAFPFCSVYGPNDPRIPYVNQVVSEKERLTIGNNTFQILSNPGHTSTHISYYEANKGWLFCGDTLFSAGCGRVFDGTMEQLHESLLLFKLLPPTTKVFCAHEYTLQNLRFALTVEPENQAIKNYLYRLKQKPNHCSLPSTMEQECLINPFLRTDKAAVKQYAVHHGAENTDSIEVFRILREQKNQF